MNKVMVEISLMGGPCDGTTESYGLPEELTLVAEHPEKKCLWIALYDRIPESPIYQYRGWKDEEPDRG